MCHTEPGACHFVAVVSLTVSCLCLVGEAKQIYISKWHAKLYCMHFIFEFYVF